MSPRAHWSFHLNVILCRWLSASNPLTVPGIKGKKTGEAPIWRRTFLRVERDSLACRQLSTHPTESVFETLSSTLIKSPNSVRINPVGTDAKATNLPIESSRPAVFCADHWSNPFWLLSYLSWEDRGRSSDPVNREKLRANSCPLHCSRPWFHNFQYFVCSYLSSCAFNVSAHLTSGRCILQHPPPPSCSYNTLIRSRIVEGNTLAYISLISAGPLFVFRFDIILLLVAPTLYFVRLKCRFCETSGVGGSELAKS